jgi:hypothetical protein
MATASEPTPCQLKHAAAPQVLLLCSLLCLTQPFLAGAQTITHVIHISADGLRPDAVTALPPYSLPNFYWLRTLGSFTDRARTDFDYTVTLPNHICQLTSRPVTGPAGHNWTDNSEPPEGITLASNKGSYIAGVFDVVHDAGLRTGFYASKEKFSLFTNSWSESSGAPDLTGSDNGRNKIDVSDINGDTGALVTRLVTDLASNAFNYAFLHLGDPDFIGHSYGWDVTPGSEYSLTIQRIDGFLGYIRNQIEADARLNGHTAIILTADHGGEGFGHGDPANPADYSIPFYLWGPGIPAGVDLYQLNPGTRQDPGTNRPTYTDSPQPIRNGEAANVALTLLGLGPVPESSIDFAQDLTWTIPPRNSLKLGFHNGQAILSFRSYPGVHYSLQTAPAPTGPWTDLVTNQPGTGAFLTNALTVAQEELQRFYRLRIQ